MHVGQHFPTLICLELSCIYQVATESIFYSTACTLIFWSSLIYPEKLFKGFCLKQTFCLKCAGGITTSATIAMYFIPFWFLYCFCWIISPEQWVSCLSHCIPPKFEGIPAVTKRWWEAPEMRLSLHGNQSAHSRLKSISTRGGIVGRFCQINLLRWIGVTFGSYGMCVLY